MAASSSETITGPPRYTTMRDSTKLSPSQRKHLLTLHAAGEHTQAELAELFNVSRTTIYRELRRTTADT